MAARAGRLSRVMIGYPRGALNAGTEMILSSNRFALPERLAVIISRHTQRYQFSRPVMRAIRGEI